MVIKQYNSLPHYMQSQAFAEYMGAIGWETVVVGSKKQPTFVYLRKAPLIGYVGKVMRAQVPVPFNEISQLVHNKKINLLRFEPQVVLPSNKKDHEALQQHFTQHGFGRTWMHGELATVLVDLTVSETDLFKSIPRENTRRNIRTAQKHGLIASETDDIEFLAHLHRKLGNKKHFYPPSEKEMKALWQAFAKEKAITGLIVTDKAKKPLAGIVLICYKGTAIYRYVGYDDGAEELRAPSLAVWESWLLAKRKGMQWFDFMGINDERAIEKSWKGFSQFKLGFSNNVVRYLEPFAYYAKPWGALLHLFDRFG